MYNVHCQCTMYNLQCTMCNVQCTICNVQCFVTIFMGYAVCSMRYAVQIMKLLVSQYRSWSSSLCSTDQEAPRYAIQIKKLLAMQYRSRSSPLCSTDHEAPRYALFSTPQLPRPCYSITNRSRLNSVQHINRCVRVFWELYDTRWPKFVAWAEYGAFELRAGGKYL
jgi:hypothetical protein